MQIETEDDQDFWSNPIGTVIEQLFVWLFAPACEPIVGFMDWVGIQGAVINIDLNQGTMGYLLGILDAWLPVHEAVAFAMWFMAVFAVWVPIRGGIKYLLPGLG